MKIVEILSKKAEFDRNSQININLEFKNNFEKIIFEIKEIEEKIENSIKKEYLNNGIIFEINFKYNNYLFEKIEILKKELNDLNYKINNGEKKLQNIEINKLIQDKYYSRLENEKNQQKLRKDNLNEL